MENKLKSSLNSAIQLREAGESEKALQQLLELHQTQPDNPLINYHCAWTYDKLGHEKEAIPFYETAIEQGLEGEALKGAMLGLGSSYRCLGHYQKAANLLRQATTLYPHDREFEIFLAMALYNLGNHQDAMEILLRNLAETSQDDGLRRFKQAILFYANNLDTIWT